MNHLLCRGRALGDEPSLGAVYAALYSSADPRRGVAPGETVQLGVSVAPDQGASRGCAYLLEAPLADSADVVAVQGLEYFPRQRWFRIRAEAGETGTGVLHLRVHDRATAPRIRPQIVVAVPDATGRKLVRTAKLDADALPLRPATARSLRITTEPGRPGTANVLSAAPAGSTAVSVTQPRGGDVQLSYDGWVTYTPAPSFTGYDRFTYTVATPAGEQQTSHVNVFVGSLDHIPGAFPQRPADAAMRPWQWPELSGEMPWPRPDQTARNR
ncbi:MULTISPECIES: Ig-like domain-containing protein [unclassified Streptomyces]|uniref:Ig-like domain-containing protein n=1 Tax=unclassified Streptomyces TaxID=2593676 RepID=UPI002E11C7DB|nr:MULTISPECIES: Ig-like domain-containing protein [unclassified Streptomyces]WSR21749.1 cadherin-like domain-containing protein [Streptomyces sp. NBC_01205]